MSDIECVCFSVSEIKPEKREKNYMILQIAISGRTIYLYGLTNDRYDKDYFIA